MREEPPPRRATRNAAMRSLFYSLLSLATVATTLAAEAPDAKRADKSTEDWEDVEPDTIFNGQTVPPMKEIGRDLEKEISHGNS